MRKTGFIFANSSRGYEAHHGVESLSLRKHRDYLSFVPRKWTQTYIHVPAKSQLLIIPNLPRQAPTGNPNVQIYRGCFSSNSPHSTSSVFNGFKTVQKSEISSETRVSLFKSDSL